MKVFVIGGATVPQASPNYPDESASVNSSMKRLGKDLIARGHDLLVCSPFPGSADFAAVSGAAEAFGTDDAAVIEYHFPADPAVIDRLDELQTSLALRCCRRFRHPVLPDQTGGEDLLYSWLFAQMAALARCQAVLALGGRADRSANLLLLLAEGQRRAVIPLPFLGGAAEASYQRRYYQLQDQLGEGIAALSDPGRVGDVVAQMEVAADPSASAGRAATPPCFFISYARDRPAEADLVELLLRRRGLVTFRDDQQFGPGQPLQGVIAEHIHQATVFVALWCQEYACSPWCFDELELALCRHEAGGLTLWLLCLDGTRIVPPRARDLVHYRVKSHDEVRKTVAELLQRIEDR